MTGFSTRAIRAASRVPDVEQRPTSVPIFQTATFTTEDAEQLGEVLSSGWAGYAYSRLSNPTTRALGDAYAELAGGESGYALASGMAAIHAALAGVLRAGDRVVAPTALYGSTRTQLVGYFGRFGVDVEIADFTDLDAVERAVKLRPTRVLYAETSANPTTFLADHAALADLAHRNGALYLADNTFASTYVCRPLDLGADLVIESATKYLGGHSDLIAGVVAGRRDLVEVVAKTQVDTGATLGPFEAFLVLRGLLTLAVRMDRHAANARALGEWMERQDGVKAVLYPGLDSHPQHDVAMRQFRPGNGGGMLAFEVVGGRDGGAAVIDAMTLTELTASLGSVHTMVVHPPSTSQRQLTEAELVESGITPGLLRVSVGLEDIEDLIADFGSALAAAREAASVRAGA
ncbi:MAG: PLP-dependent aspartate aminotransferase family protein [Chloroflexota bacterium]